jgi:hypothetical protein
MQDMGPPVMGDMKSTDLGIQKSQIWIMQSHPLNEPPRMRFVHASCPYSVIHFQYRMGMR